MAEITDPALLAELGRGAPSAPSGGMVLRKPSDPFKAADDRRAEDANRRAEEAARLAREAANKPPSGFSWSADGKSLIAIPGGPADPNADPKTGSRQEKANVILGMLDNLQTLYDSDIKGQPASRLFGLTERVDSLPKNERFRSAGMNLLPLIRPLVAQSAKEGDSDKEMEIFLSYIPSNDDSDINIESKMRMLRALVGGVVEGKTPSEIERIASGAAQDQGMPGVTPGVFGGSVPPGGPAGPGGGLDTTQQRIAPPSGGDAISLAQGGSRTASNPALAGVNARVNKMLQGRESDAAIAGYLREVGVDPDKDPKLATSLARAFEFRRKNPDYQGPYSVDLEGQVNIPLSGTQQFMNNAGQSGFGAGTIAAADMMTAGTLDNMTANPGMTRALMDGVREQNPGASFAGSLIGGGLMAGGAELGAGLGLARLGAQRFAPVAGDMLFGTAYGAGASDDDRLGGAVGGGLASVGGGMFGRAATRGTGRALTGARDASTRYLADRGVPLTLGQIAGQGGVVGRTVRGLEDKLESVPLIGDAIRSRRLEGVRAFNQQAMGQALEPIGANVAGEVGEEGIEGARGAVNQAYRDALSGVSVQPDAPFVTDMQGALARGQGLPGNMAGEFAYTVQNRVAPEFENGALTGEGYQAIRQGLRRDRRAMQSQPRGHDFGDAVRGVEGAAESLVRRGAPEVVPALNNADSAFGRLKVVEDAVGRGVNTEGLFSPAQLGMAARANAKRFGGNQATTQRPFFDLQRAGQEVLPSQVPNSGTTDRAIAAALVPAAVGGAGYGLDIIGPEEAALLASFGLPYTAAGRAALQRGLVARPGPVRALGESVIQRSRVGGMFGAGAAAPLALGYSGQ